ncbi:MAG: rane-associated zinc metalloprotease, partial [Dehalococcoidia bacterium]|nr:rane-associated zinc metalloprotease [Dehalococcoidia bacterium]
GSLASKGIITRLGILSAGSAMNAIFPILLFSVAFMMPGPVPDGPVRIVQVLPGSPSETAGLRPDDVVLAINGVTIEDIKDVGRNIQASMNTELEMQLSRDGERYTTRMVPRSNPPPGEGATGIVITNLVIKSYPVWEAVPKGFSTSFEMLGQIKSGMVRLFTGEEREGLQLTGPIGIAQLTGEVAQQGGLPGLLGIAAFLSINLAVLNMLPIPALDGGRCLFVLIEGLRGGKRVPPEREGLVHLVGFAFLMALILIISANDLRRILSGESLLP